MRVKTVVIFILGLFETNSFVIVIRMIPKNTLPLLNQVRLTNRSYVRHCRIPNPSWSLLSRKKIRNFILTSTSLFWFTFWKLYVFHDNLEHAVSILVVLRIGKCFNRQKGKNLT